MNASLVVIVVLVIAVVGYVWYRLAQWKKKLRAETHEAEETITKSFTALREEVEDEAAKLDDQPGLNEKEQKVADNLKDALNVSEEFIRRDMKDIERDLE